MPLVTLGFGLALIAVGLVGYFGSETRSPTALIPAGFGVVFLVLALLAYRPGVRKHAMHAAAAVGLVGFLAAGWRLVKALTADTIAHPRAAISQGFMAGLCLIFVGLCVASFISARRSRARTAGQATSPPAGV